jgi:hypothetical protein
MYVEWVVGDWNQNAELYKKEWYASWYTVRYTYWRLFVYDYILQTMIGDAYVWIIVHNWK